MRFHDVSAPFFQRFHLPPPVNNSNNIFKAVYFCVCSVRHAYAGQMCDCSEGTDRHPRTQAFQDFSLLHKYIWRDFTIKCCFHAAERRHDYINGKIITALNKRSCLIRGVCTAPSAWLCGFTACTRLKTPESNEQNIHIQDIYNICEQEIY